MRHIKLGLSIMKCCTLQTIHYNLEQSKFPNFFVSKTAQQNGMLLLKTHFGVIGWNKLDGLAHQVKPNWYYMIGTATLSGKKPLSNLKSKFIWNSEVIDPLLNFEQ